MNQTWTNYLPKFAKNRLEENQLLQRIIHNTGWLFIDKALRMGVGFFVTVWVTRYLGPERYGTLSYSLAFVGLFTAVANLGLQGIVVRDLVHCPEQTDEILCTAFVLKLAGGLTSLLLSLGIVCFLRPNESLLFWMVGIAALGLVFQAFDALDFWFQSKLLSKRMVLASIPGFVLITVVKIFLVVIEAPLIAFAWAWTLETLLGGIGLLVAYQVVTKRATRLKFSTKLAKRLLSDCWPLIFAGLMLMMYNRIDQVMIGQILDSHAVGIYSVAVKLSELWYFLPLITLNSIFPAILEAKKSGDSKFYEKRVQKVMDLIATIAFLFVLPLSMFSKSIIMSLYGVAYLGSASILTVYVLSAIFYLLGYIREYWVAAENIAKFSLYSTGVGATINILLNLYLIPRYGGIGAAYATLIAIFFGGYLVNAVCKKTRPIFLMQTRSLFLMFFFEKVLSGAGQRNRGGS